MKILTEKPKIYDRLNKEFGADWDKGVIITYGGNIYCKAGAVSPDLLVHEMVHVRQQEGWDADEYAEKYLNDKLFRYEKEVEAYKAQADWLRKNVRDRNKLNRILRHIWTAMSTMYGDMITFQEAQKLI
jgi:hypothetical protein